MNENLKKLLLARQVMEAANEAHNHEIFMEATVNREEEVVEFAILPSNLEHATDIGRILNLTLSYIEGNEKRQTKFYLR